MLIIILKTPLHDGEHLWLSRAPVKHSNCIMSWWYCTAKNKHGAEINYKPKETGSWQIAVCQLINSKRASKSCRMALKITQQCSMILQNPCIDTQCVSKTMYSNRRICHECAGADYAVVCTSAPDPQTEVKNSKCYYNYDTRSSSWISHLAQQKKHMQIRNMGKVSGSNGFYDYGLVPAVGAQLM